jgi:hypothetical protein
VLSDVGQFILLPKKGAHMNASSKIIVVCLSVLTTGLTAGFLVGKATSLDYDNPETAHRYVVMYSRWERVSARPLVGRLSVRVGSEVFSYTDGDSEVKLGAVDPLEASRLPRPTKGFDKDFEKLVAAVGAPTGIIATILSQSGTKAEKLSGKGMWILGALTAGTFAVGYSFGHDDEPHYGGPKFREALKNDIYIWREDEKFFHVCYQGEVFKMILKPNSLADKLGLSAIDPAGSKEQQFCRQSHPELRQLAATDPSVL